jgi:hypothetical protein
MYSHQDVLSKQQFLQVVASFSIKEKQKSINLNITGRMAAASNGKITKEQAREIWLDATQPIVNMAISRSNSVMAEKRNV